MQNMAILCELMIGTTEAASSEVQPMTRARLGVEANIWFTAGTASAGSPRVSTPLQVRLWPRTPPALLMAAVAPSQETRYVGPSAASAPLNGATSAMVSLPDPVPELLLADVEPPELPQAASPAASTTAPSAAVRVRELHCPVLQPWWSDVAGLTR